MGNFATADQVKRMARVDILKSMDSEVIEDLFIIPAERMIEEAFNLDLNTDYIPYHWEAAFDDKAWKQTNFENDYRRAVIYLVNRMAVNEHNYSQQSVRGATASYRVKIPRESAALMRRWGKPREVFRT